MSLPIAVIRLDTEDARRRLIGDLYDIGFGYETYIDRVGLANYPYIAVDAKSINLLTDEEGPRASFFMQDRPVTQLNSPRQMIAYVKRMRRA